MGNCGTWEPGAVIGHGYTDERLDGQVYPYQVRLDDGRLFCVPADEDRSIRVHEVAENGDDEEDDDDDSSDDDDDDENEAGREHLFVGEVPDSKYLCILIPVKGTKRKQEDEQQTSKRTSQKTSKRTAKSLLGARARRSDRGRDAQHKYVHGLRSSGLHAGWLALGALLLESNLDPV